MPLIECEFNNIIGVYCAHITLFFDPLVIS